MVLAAGGEHRAGGVTREAGYRFTVRHCERSEAIQVGVWIATALRASQ